LDYGERSKNVAEVERGKGAGMARGRDRGVKPFGHTAIAKFLEARIEEMKGFKTQREIAEEVGFNTPNMISMLKNGDSKIPLDKIALLARALDVDPGHLLRLGLEQYWTGLGDVIDEVFGHIASANEFELFLKKWRQVTENTDPRPTRSMKYEVDVTIEQIARSAGHSD
jgi:transcriptional regulator with XRE-family HTH domain